jgi:hypothetical protein
MTRREGGREGGGGRLGNGGVRIRMMRKWRCENRI